ncbi:hypothetical protein ACFHW2_12175 [Actinomadura sp. LOL_016]|uniref:hypothetical protein n=1 Tax=unclassified Actinomadura TaxID=2626254 RepID=UPI003A80DD4C
MTGRGLLVTVVVAAAGGGVFLAAMLPLDTPAAVTAEGAYLGQARAQAATLRGASDDRLLNTGLALCGAFGQAPDPAVTPIPLDGVTDAELAAVTDAATRHLCPSQRTKVHGYLQEGDR